MKTKKSNNKKFILATALYLIGLLLILIIVDNFIMPAIVHDRKTVRIPKITGIPIDKAKILLRNNGLDYYVASEQFNGKFPVGTVLKQSPDPFAKVKVGRRVYVTLSKGRENVIVPYLTGKSLRAANTLLTQRGLFLGDTLYEFSELYQSDTIIAQSIRAGQAAFFGDSIDVVLSKGSENQVLVPKFIGLSLSEAENAIFQNGLKLGTINYFNNDGTYLPNTVIDQSPITGDKVPANTTINLIIVK